MESHKMCPNCGRNLTEDEMYCYFCEADLPESEGKSKKHPDKKQK